MLLQLREDSPLRPPDWRWQKVVAYREAGRRIPRSKTDPLLSKVYRFSTLLDNCEDDFDSVELSEQYPELCDAHTIYKHDGASSSKWELEARLLARESYESINQKMHITPETVDTYEQVFFNVNDRLTSKSWIINCVIGRSIHAGLTERDYDLLWKMYGLFSGPIMLDVVIGKMGLKDQHAASFDQSVAMLRDSLDVQSVIAASKSFAIAPVNGFTAVPLIQVEQAYRQMAKDSAGAASTQTFLQSVDQIMSSLPWCVGSGTIKHPVLDSMNVADSLAAELRIDEMIGVANGDNLLGLKDLRLPEPEGKNGNEQA
jgi:hypothetical protein